LQQDFNIFVVNLFDTYHGSKLLGTLSRLALRVIVYRIFPDFPRHGLANLLEMYCDFTPDKRYQLADWRIRYVTKDRIKIYISKYLSSYSPLPEEMLQYARSDTHYLLYIYDNLRNALLDRATSRAQSRAQSPSSSNTTLHFSSVGNAAHELIKQVLARSEETALRIYEKEVYDAEGGSGSNGWDTLARKWNKGVLMVGGQDVGIGALQRAVYKGVHKWRDAVARQDDESIR
jgi:exosome complex exonuclease RRP6